MSAMTETIDLSLYASRKPTARAGMDLAVEGIACGGCIGRIESAVKSLPGVAEARLNFTNRRLHVAWTDALTEPSQILRALAATSAIAAIRSSPCAPSRKKPPRRAG